MSFNNGQREMKSIYSKTPYSYSKDKEITHNDGNQSLKSEHLPKLEKNLKRLTPSPISTRVQLSSSITSFPFNNYKNQTKMLQGNKSSKPISVNRKGRSLDLSQNDSFSLNKSKISTNSIYKKVPNKKIISLRSNTPNLSMTSLKKLNRSEANSNNGHHHSSLVSKNKTPVKSTALLSNPNYQKANHNIFNKNVPSGRNIFGSLMNKTTKKQMINKKKSNSSFSQNFNYSQMMSQKRILEINTSIAKTDKKDKTTATSSDSSLITKEMTPKIQKSDMPHIKIESQSQTQTKITKRIKCMHDLSKTGLSGEEKKVNQDTYFIFKNFSNQWDYIYMGVCDGHGYYGHEVSAYIKENLPMDLNHAIKEQRLNILTDNLEKVITQTFESQNYNLLTNTMIDCKLSGTTCVSVLYSSEKLIIANIGDSRAVIGKCLNNRWEHKDLSRDHKPTEKDEAERILKTGGRIRQMRDDDGSFIGPMRVYMKEKDMPGLSMTRSFGDYFASTAGCISIPEVNEYYFQAEDKFMIIASDGLWEFIESHMVVDIVKDFYLNDDIVGCCEFLYKESCRRWLHEEEDVIDDITIILVFFE